MAHVGEHNGWGIEGNLALIPTIQIAKYKATLQLLDRRLGGVHADK